MLQTGTFMKFLTLLIMFLLNTAAQAVIYDEYEIQYQLQNKDLNHDSSALINAYFTAKNPDSIIDEFLSTDMSPIKREYILHQLLTAISQQPPQAFFQSFIDQMKSYNVIAMRAADGGHSPQALFNITSKAYGIENIWTAYRTEQRFSQLFLKKHNAVIYEIKQIVNSGSRPAWLGFKNSFKALKTENQIQFANHLYNLNEGLVGLDRLISFVGLNTQHIPLIEKALVSQNVAVREYTLRRLNDHLNQTDAKRIIMDSVTNGPDTKFSTSLLGQYASDKDVQATLINQLNHKISADSAAFALSQVDDKALHEQLRLEFLKNNNQVAKNHILLALKLNGTASSNLVLNELQKSLTKSSAGAKWLQSFEGEEQ